MITGILLIGLGFALGYRKIRKTGTAVQSLTRLPVLIEAVGRAVSNETETIKPNMDAIMMKLTALQVKLGDFRDQNGQREWAVEVCSCSPQKSQQFNLIFSGSPYRRLGQGLLDNHPERAMQWDSLAPFPDYRHYPPLPHSTASVTLCTATRASRSVTGAANGTGPDGCLPELDMFPLLQVCVYGICAFVLRCFFVLFFPVLRLYSKWSIVWGLNFIYFFSPPLSSCKSCIFLNSLSSCSVYPVVICMLCMYGQVDG